MAATEQIETGEPLYLTAAELAYQLHVDPKTVYRWAQEEPSMPVLRIRGLVRFPRERVLRWLADHEQGQARPRRRSTCPPMQAIPRTSCRHTQEQAVQAYALGRH